MELEEIPSVYVGENPQIPKALIPEPLPRKTQRLNRRLKQNKNERARWTETPPPDPTNSTSKSTTPLGGLSTPNSGANSPFEAPNSDGALRFSLKIRKKLKNLALKMDHQFVLQNRHVERKCRIKSDNVFDKMLNH